MSKFQYPEESVTIGLKWMLENFADGIFKAGEQITSPIFFFDLHQFSIQLTITDSNKYSVNVNYGTKYLGKMQPLTSDFKFSILNSENNIIVEPLSNTKSICVFAECKIMHRISCSADKRDHEFECKTVISKLPEFEVSCNTANNFNYSMVFEEETIQWEITLQKLGYLSLFLKYKSLTPMHIKFEIYAKFEEFENWVYIQLLSCGKMYKKNKMEMVPILESELTLSKIKIVNRYAIQNLPVIY